MGRVGRGATEAYERARQWHPHCCFASLPPFLAFVPHTAGSNAKALWVKSRPMNDEELLQQQVVMSTSASLGQSVWVYRGSMVRAPPATFRSDLYHNQVRGRPRQTWPRSDLTASRLAVRGGSRGAPPSRDRRRAAGAASLNLPHLLLLAHGAS